MTDKYKEKAIDGMSCQVNQFTGTISFKLLVELVQLLGPTLSSLVGVSTNNVSVFDASITPEIISKAVEQLALKLDPEQNLDFILRILSLTKVDGVDVTSGSFDLIFQGKILSVFKLIRFALETNYQDFLSAGDFQKKKQTQPPVSTIPT